MLSRQIKQLAQAIVGSGSSTAPLFEAAFSISSVLDSLLNSCFKNVGAPQSINTQNIVVSGVTTAVRAHKVWAVHEAARQYLAALSSASDALNRADDQLTVVREDLTVFMDLYGEFLARQSFENAFSLAAQARALEKSLTGMVWLSELILDLMAEDVAIDEEGVLTLFSPMSTPSSRELSRILASIQWIYDEVEKIIDGYSDSTPLTILKLETGSLYASFKGAPKVIRFVGGILRRAMAYGAKNHTVSGSLAQVPTAVQGIEGVMRLRAQMAEAGMSQQAIQAMDEQIEASATNLAKHVAVVVERMSEIGVNGEIFGVGKEVAEQLKLGHEMRRIEHEERDPD